MYRLNAPSGFKMHPCLGVDEILRLLAYELVTSGAKAATVILACCCKGFEDPMLDALWETQDRFLPLLKSLPEDVWKVDAGKFVSPPVAFGFPPPNHPAGEVFQTNPDKSGMGWFL